MWTCRPMQMLSGNLSRSAVFGRRRLVNQLCTERQTVLAVFSRADGPSPLYTRITDRSARLRWQLNRSKHDNCCHKKIKYIAGVKWVWMTTFQWYVIHAMTATTTIYRPGWCSVNCKKCKTFIIQPALLIFKTAPCNVVYCTSYIVAAFFSNLARWF